MIDQQPPTNPTGSAEDRLRAAMARSDAMASSARPVLVHLLKGGGSIVDDEIVAITRGMLNDVARQLAGDGDPASLRHALMQQSALLSHLHAVALEWQLARRLEHSASIDPVVPPLLQSLAASADAAVRDHATQLIAAQARWREARVRMRLPLTDLPMEQRAAIDAVIRSLEVPAQVWDFHEAEREGAGRTALIERLVAAIGHDTPDLLDPLQAGGSVFLTALALRSGQERDAVGLATHRSQWARLALMLRAAGQTPREVARAALALHPDLELPVGLDALNADRANTILTDTQHARG